MPAYTAAIAWAARATLLPADAHRLPLAAASLGTIVAAGLLPHLPELGTGLRELARVTAPGGLMILFHPTGRAALAARHRRVVRDDEVLSEAPLRAAAERTGWRLRTYDDAPHRFFAVAVRGWDGTARGDAAPGMGPPGDRPMWTPARPGEPPGHAKSPGPSARGFIGGRYWD
ncbi:hypothetical protein Afil01_02280 [Actinorhabdospora filicis]|uniref:Methyltransferase type 11 domain-containing protein n=1 Tax=Actinorhabdospora filicis TaxID=1785913 RepID=A0A9W6SH94_9ACTN|nr:methyltransferase domain-containing protein [Actinorhabdospora filicis]GLZ75421.1 hypothetical protein Afil01_02280 [Actinorhabdospora filicis]